MLTLLTQLVAVVVQNSIIIAALKTVPVVMLSVRRHYVHRDANTFYLIDIFHIRVANNINVAWRVECKPLLYHLSGGGGGRGCLCEFLFRSGFRHISHKCLIHL